MLDHIKHNRFVIKSFEKQAARMENVSAFLTSRENLEWALENMELKPSDVVLDVASATGIFTRAMSGLVKEVVGSDITPKMVEKAEMLAKEDGINNINFITGSAESMPFKENSFDVVVTGMAAHHFANPLVILREMHRVCKPNGKVVMIDITCSEDSQLAQNINDLERLRDYSHARFIPQSEMQEMMKKAGLTIDKNETRRDEVDFDRWIGMTQPEKKNYEEIYKRLHEDLNGRFNTGMNPFMRNGKIFFTYSTMLLSGIKKE